MALGLQIEAWLKGRRVHFGGSRPLRCSRSCAEDEGLDVRPVFSHSGLVSGCPRARCLHGLLRLSDTTSFVMCLSKSLPIPAHPTARLWRGAGLASVSITEAGWVTSARLDSPPAPLQSWPRGPPVCPCTAKKDEWIKAAEYTHSDPL